MNHLFQATLVPTFLVVSLGALASASESYVLDDGSSEAALGFSGTPVDYCWLQWFQAVGGQDTIVTISAHIGTTVPNGTPITLCVWEDPTDDGDPHDATLVSMITRNVHNTGPNSFTDYPLPQPAVVHGIFFVGAFMTTDGTESPATLDYNAPYSGRAWFTWDYEVGGFDPTHLGANPNSLYHIETLGAGIHGVFLVRAEGTGATPETYCTAKTNSLACIPHIGSTGAPSASAGAGFVVHASGLLNRQNGMLFYGTNGRAQLPYLGGTLCVAAPLHRTVVQNAGGSPSGTDCTGIYAFDFNAWIASGNDLSLLPGTTVNVQFYSRDPGFPLPENVGFTDALEFTIAP